jgi:hypothetical protein
MDSKHFAYKKLREQIKHENDEKYRANSKKRLLINVSKKFRTTMVGALAAFEKKFKHLWEEYPELRQLWEEARTEVLDIGNNNLRAAEQEISEYTITWDRYRTEFVFNQNQENRDNEKH